MSGGGRIVRVEVVQETEDRGEVVERSRMWYNTSRTNSGRGLSSWTLGQRTRKALSSVHH